VKRIAMIGIAVLAAGATAACSTASGPEANNVISKAPLTVPPQFNLVPPAPGQARPQELSPEAQARVAVFGVDYGQTASEGERAFVRAAGGGTTERTVRSLVDFDEAEILRKNRSFADMILNWGASTPASAVIDPAAEAERLRVEAEAVQGVTGGGTVVIQPKATSKLPGL
jgi:hypothetical protein